MKRPSFRILAGTVLLAGLALAMTGLRPAIAAATHDVIVRNTPDAPAQVEIANADEPFHASNAFTFGVQQNSHRVLLFTAPRRMILEHVSGRIQGTIYDTPNFTLELEAPGRKTLAVHEVPVTQAWIYPENVGVPDNERLRMIASQPIRLIVDAGQSLYFRAQLPYQTESSVTVSASGHYAPGKAAPAQ